MQKRTRRHAAGLAAALLLAALLPLPAAAQWALREEGGAVEAGSTVDGEFAGLLIRCSAADGLRIVLTHNGAVFDRERSHTIVISVDGTARVLPASAVESPRPGDDDFVHSGTAQTLEPLLSALARGRDLEISAPSGRYGLGLEGSSRAIAGLRERCSAGR